MSRDVVQTASVRQSWPGQRPKSVGLDAQSADYFFYRRAEGAIGTDAEGISVSGCGRDAPGLTLQLSHPMGGEAADLHLQDVPVDD